MRPAARVRGERPNLKKGEWRGHGKNDCQKHEMVPKNSGKEEKNHMYLEEEMQKLQASIDSLAKRVEYLEARNIDVVLTAKQFSAWAHVNISQVYLWINSGQIETLPRLGKLHRIPLSQFYTEKGKMVGVTLNADGTPRRKKTSGDNLSEKFQQYLQDVGHTELMVR